MVSQLVTALSRVTAGGDWICAGIGRAGALNGGRSRRQGNDCWSGLPPNAGQKVPRLTTLFPFDLDLTEVAALVEDALLVTGVVFVGTTTISGISAPATIDCLA